MYYNIVNKGIETNDEKYIEELINYCEKITFYFQERIEKNILQIKNKEIIKTVQLYKEKDKKYYPEIISILANDLIKNKQKRMTFVP